MANRRRYSPEQIVMKLREAEVFLSQDPDPPHWQTGRDSECNSSPLQAYFRDHVFEKWIQNKPTDRQASPVDRWRL